MAVYQDQASPMAVLSKKLPNPNWSKVEWPFYQPEAAKWPGHLDLGCGLPISYCPAQAVCQRPSRAIFFTECHSIKAIGRSGRFIKGNGRFIKAGQPQRLILSWPSLHLEGAVPATNRV